MAKQPWNRFNFTNGYIGWCMTREQMKLEKQVIEAQGIRVRTKQQHDWPSGVALESYSLFTTPEDVRRAREIRRGFKAGMTMRGDTFDFLLGVRAAVILRQGKKNGRPRLAETAELNIYDMKKILA